MKNVIFATALSLVGAGAEARSIMIPGGTFESTYNLDTFTVGQGSNILPPVQTIRHAEIMINRQTHELKLVVLRRFSCPPKMFCAAVMPAPIEVVLPITYHGSPFC